MMCRRAGFGPFDQLKQHLSTSPVALDRAMFGMFKELRGARLRPFVQFNQWSDDVPTADSTQPVGDVPT